MTEYDQEAFLEDLWHRRRIHDALLRYCRGVDRKDFALMRSAYHEDAFDDHGTYKGDVDGLISWVDRRHAHVEQSMHVIANCIIERDADIAVAETYCVAYQRFSADARETRSMYLSGEDVDTAKPIQIVCTVRYVDRFEMRGSEWKIAYRTVIMESVQSEIIEVPIPEESWVMQRRDADDALWEIREAAGLPSTEAVLGTTL